MKTNTVVIGAGPGGYVAAIRLAQLKVETLIVEELYLGGTCLNVGCIPSKALIHAAKNFYKTAHEFADMGIFVDSPRIDFEKTIAWKDGIVKKLTGGIQTLLKGNGVKILFGKASFLSEKALLVKNGESEEIVEFEHCIIATGSVPTKIPGFEPDQNFVLDSTGALSLKKLPQSMCVIGGGYIGIELSMVYAKLGTKVCIIETQDQILSGFDPDVVTLIERKLKKLKVKVYTNAKAKSWSLENEKANLLISTQKQDENLLCDHIFVSVGRIPNTNGLNLQACGLQIDSKGFIPVNSRLQTQKSHIYAIGDLVGQPMLAHKASKEGEVAAENIAGHSSEMDICQIPAVVFTDPEIAKSGMDEKDASEKKIDVVVSKFPYAAIGRSLTTNETEGFVKMIREKSSGNLLGVTIVGANASDLISEAALAIEMTATVEDIALTIHPHPTFGEILMEAAKGNLGEAIHILP